MGDMNWPKDPGDQHLDHWHHLPGFPEPDWPRMSVADTDRLIDELRLHFIERESGMEVTEFKAGRYPSRYWQDDSSNRL